MAPTELPRPDADPEALSAEEKRQRLMQFGARAVHDLAGPIDQISSLLALFLRRYNGKIDRDADALLTHIDAARLRLSNTGNALRRYFQIVTAACERTEVDMNSVWKSAAAALSRQIAESEAEVHVNELPVVTGDREMLGLLFQAVLDNALKFRRKDVRPSVWVSAQRQGNRQVIEVLDNGIGIDPASCEVVFEPFKRLSGHLYPGAGLGLAMARTIADLHGGCIRIEPAETGARVRVELPVSAQMTSQATNDDGLR
jgi:light-regulated signal transduction histidine kinase (bacteriophytochrome)